MKLHRCKELSYLKQPWADLKINFCYEPPDLAGQFDYETWAMIPAEDDKRKRINMDTILSSGTWRIFNQGSHT